jgi:transforming growth factor-beta-induced protein
MIRMRSIFSPATALIAVAALLLSNTRRLAAVEQRKSDVTNLWTSSTVAKNTNTNTDKNNDYYNDKVEQIKIQVNEFVQEQEQNEFHQNDDNEEDILVAHQVDKTMVELISTTPKLKTLTAAIQAADLVDALSGVGPYTVFAPWDNAFADLPDELVTKLLEPEWILHLQDVLQYHVYEGLVSQSSLLTNPRQKIRMMNGQDASIVVTADKKVKVNGSNKAIAYYEPTNGVAYMMDQVLLPAFVSQSVMDVANSTADTSTLASLIKMAGLEKALNDPQANVTVFAPTNAAFEALDPTLLEFLQSPQGAETLETVLLYHVVPGGVYTSGVNIPPSGQAANLPTLAMPDGQTASVGRDASDIVSVNEVVVSIPNVLANNGIVHVIPQVLIPPILPHASGVDEGEATSAPSTAPVAAATATGTPTVAPVEEATTTSTPVGGATATSAPVEGGTMTIPANTTAPLDPSPSSTEVITPTAEPVDAPSATVISPTSMPAAWDGSIPGQSVPTPSAAISSTLMPVATGGDSPSSAACADHAQCASLGLLGDCCPAPGNTILVRPSKYSAIGVLCRALSHHFCQTSNLVVRYAWLLDFGAATTGLLRCGCSRLIGPYNSSSYYNAYSSTRTYSNNNTISGTRSGGGHNSSTDLASHCSSDKGSYRNT